MGNRCVLLHINRKVKKIFIFAANLKQKKEKVLGINGKFLFEPDGTLSTLYKDLTTPGNKLENFDNWKQKD